ncbi:type II secretion system F family protein [Actinoplanes friuliensis]|uniref:Type II secretion system protein n=1 Tax=Actinoplanes friuliensis DSM 7358 TaxID=1246995 RepID=U5VVJ3_9ACTN|nr:type II secretion system F family protein [Actinoplanes friuliensis]AGZ39646.1 type II secretion system protein [Actinoplanes friuliensis DSM 7358]
MALLLVELFAVVTGAAAVGLLVLAVALPPTRGERMMRTLGMFGNTRRHPLDERGPTVDQRLRAAAGGAFDRLGRAVTPPGARVRLVRLLDYAGNPDDRPIDAVVRRRGQLMVAAGLAGALLGAALWGTPGAVLAGPAAAVFGLFIPDLVIYDIGVKRQKDLAKSLPDVLDALVIGVEAGLGLDAAMAQVAGNLSGPMPSEVHRVLQEMKIGIARTDALRSLSARTTVRELQSFVTAVVQAGELGVPIAGVLREHARDQRTKRRQRAEEQAQKVPIKLLFPVLFCLFPVIFVVILGPGVLRLLDTLNR